MPRKGRKRLTVDIPEGFHREFKKLAALHNITMSKLIIRMIVGRIKRQQELSEEK